MPPSFLLRSLIAITSVSASALAGAAPTISRLTPPSELFASGSAEPIISRFVAGQRFDLQASVRPDGDRAIREVRFFVDGQPVKGDVTLVPADAPGLPAKSVVATRRAFSMTRPGVHVLSARAVDEGGQVAEVRGNFEIVALAGNSHVPKNIIILLGDGMGIAHRTAARIMAAGVTQGKAKGRLAMDTFPVTGIVMTHSLNSIVTDSSPGMSNYVTGNKAANNQEGVFPDDTVDPFDNPRVEYLSEFLHRLRRKSLGIVTTADVFDATPAAMAVHTANRGAGTGIVDQYLDDRDQTGLKVLMGGGRKWFLPSTTPGSARSAANDYVLPADLVAGWGVARGSRDPERDLIADFQAAGYRYAATRTELKAVAGTDRLLGLFSMSNMNVAKDKIDGRRGDSTIVQEYGFPDQPMLDEMATKALDVLARDPAGFLLMIEGASIDKQAHNMDTERWVLDTIEFDKAVGVAKKFAETHPDTLVLVTADHECGGINIIGASRVTNGDLINRSAQGAGTATGGPRNGVVGTYEAAGFPRYTMAADGYPTTTDVDHKMLVGYAANADRNEDWLTHLAPLRDPQQPFNGKPPLSKFPTTPRDRAKGGGFAVTGQIEDAVAAHTASDVPLSAFGAGASLFSGVMDNTEVFFRILRAGPLPK